MQLDNLFTTIVANTFNSHQFWRIRPNFVTKVGFPFWTWLALPLNSKIERLREQQNNSKTERQTEIQKKTGRKRQRDRLVDGYIIWLKIFSKYKVYRFINTFTNYFFIIYFSYFTKVYLITSISGLLITWHLLTHCSQCIPFLPPENIRKP